MASYFEEHGLDPESSTKRPNNIAPSTTNSQIHDFLGLGTSDSSSNTSTNNDFVRLANIYANLLQQRGGGLSEDSEQQELLDNLITQLLEESTENCKGPPPASKAFINNLPKVQAAQLRSGATCSICKDVLDVASSPVVELPCKHQFDHGCLTPWLELHNTCPVCRLEVPSDDPAWIKKKNEAEAASERDWMYG